jgi:hypothetical protein
MNQKLIKEFLEKTEKLGLLAEVRLEGTYAEFTNSIMVTFAKTKSGDAISTFLIELFLMPISSRLAARPDISPGALDPLARSFFASCSRFFETSLGAYFSSSAGDPHAKAGLKAQYDAYLLELKQREEERLRLQQEQELRRQLEARRQEEERLRLQQEEALRLQLEARRQEEERLRQEQEERRILEQGARQWEKERLKTKIKSIIRFLFIGIPSGILVGLPLFTHGLLFYQEWVPAGNITAFVFYVILACAISLWVCTGRTEEVLESETGRGEADFIIAVLAVIFVVYHTFNFWADVPNHIRTALIISIFVAPWIPYVRGALALYCSGNISWFLLYYLCRFLSWVLWGILGIVSWIWAWVTQDIKTANPGASTPVDIRVQKQQPVAQDQVKSGLQRQDDAIKATQVNETPKPQELSKILQEPNLAAAVHMSRLEEVKVAKQKYDSLNGSGGEPARLAYVSKLAKIYADSMAEYHATGQRKDDESVALINIEWNSNPISYYASAAELTRLIVGDWDSPRRTYRFKADGSYGTIEADVREIMNGSWDVRANQIYLGNEAHTLILVTDEYLIFSPSQGMSLFHSRHRSRSAERAMSKFSSSPTNDSKTQTGAAATLTVRNNPGKQSLLEIEDTRGRKILAEVLALTSETVLVRTEYGNVSDIALSRLSETSRQKILDWRFSRKSMLQQNVSKK